MANTKKTSVGALLFERAKAMAPDPLLFHIESFALQQEDQFQAICNGKRILHEYRFSVRAIEAGLDGIASGNIPIPSKRERTLSEAAGLAAAAKGVNDYLDSDPDNAAMLQRVTEPLKLSFEDPEEDFPEVLEAYNKRCTAFVYRLLHPE